MGYALAQEQRRFIERLVKAGRYNNQSEVVREAHPPHGEAGDRLPDPPPLTRAQVEAIYGAHDPQADASDKPPSKPFGRRRAEGPSVNAWEVYEADLGWGNHPVVIVSHPTRAARKDIVEVSGLLLAARESSRRRS